MRDFVIIFMEKTASLDYCAYPATPKVHAGPRGVVTDCAVLLSVASSLQQRTIMAQTAQHCCRTRSPAVTISHSLPLYQGEDVFEDIRFVAEQGKAWVRGYKERQGEGVGDVIAVRERVKQWFWELGATERAAHEVALGCIRFSLTYWQIHPCLFSFQIWSFPNSEKDARGRGHTTSEADTQTAAQMQPSSLWSDKRLHTFKLGLSLTPAEQADG